MKKRNVNRQCGGYDRMEAKEGVFSVGPIESTGFQNFLEALYIVLLFLVLKISEFRKGGAGG